MSTVNRILCMGDSLTAGYYGDVNNYTPYANTLSQQLGVPVDQIGKSGWKVDEMVAGMMNPNCIDVFGKASPGLYVQLQNEKYSTCVIMAGTNDLPGPASAEQIVKGLIELHEQCLGSSLRTVAISIPESRFTGTTPAMEIKRRQVNSALQQWCAAQNGRSLYVDMAALVGYSDHNGQWDQDGLHMTSYGYSHFGGVLASRLQGWHKSRVSSTPARRLSANAAPTSHHPVPAHVNAYHGSRRVSAPSILAVAPPTLVSSPVMYGAPMVVM